MIQIDELQKKYGIGLTGGIASGKTTVASILADLGFPVIDADLLSRKAVKPGTKGLAKVVSTFGGVILDEDGQLNRGKLGKIVFDDPSKLKKLESIIHPEIDLLLFEELEVLGLFQHPRHWFYEAALLFETKTDIKYKCMLTVKSNSKIYT